MEAYQRMLITDTNTDEVNESVASDLESMSEKDVEDIATEELLEPWVDWIKRTTHKIEEIAASIDIQNWVTKARAAKWRLAERISKHDPTRWTYIA